MKWISVNTGVSNENYELWEDDKKLINISFSPKTSIARLATSISKRLFFFERKGLLSPKAILKNEYGIKMGKVQDVKAGKGYLELNDKKYCFVFDKNNGGEVVLYDELMKNNLLKCSFNLMSGTLYKTKNLLDTKIPSLLMALCWYYFSSKE